MLDDLDARHQVVRAVERFGDGPDPHVGLDRLVGLADGVLGRVDTERLDADLALRPHEEALGAARVEGALRCEPRVDVMGEHLEELAPLAGVLVAAGDLVVADEPVVVVGAVHGGCGERVGG